MNKIIYFERVKEMANAIWTYEIKTEAKENYAVISCQAVDENADRFIFHVRRYKDKATKEEHLNIKVYETGSKDTCAEIERVSLNDLENKLINLRVYGVLLGRKHFPKIRQEIEKAYLEMIPRYVDDSTVLTKAVVNEIYELFVRYIKEVGINADNGFYHIPVDEFKEYISDTKYNKYKYSDIRSGLARFEKEVNGKSVKGTKCSYGRNDNTIAIPKSNKRIKVISFVQEVVDSYQITKLPQQKT